MISLQSSAPPTGQNQPLVDSKVDPLPSSSTISSSPYSSLPGESICTTTQVAKKKKKGKKNKKKIQRGGNQATIASNETSSEKLFDKPHKL